MRWYEHLIGIIAIISCIKIIFIYLLTISMLRISSISDNYLEKIMNSIKSLERTSKK